MAVTSPQTPLGTPLPPMIRSDLDGMTHDLSQLPQVPVLLVFACNHCPYVKHVESALGALISEYAPQQLLTWAVGSNDVESYPEDDVTHLRAQVQRANWPFTYLMDPDQSFARRLGAVCTPDFFLFDAEHKLAYRGAFDGSTPGNDQPVTGADLRAALDAVLAGQPVPQPHRPAMGCSIKWRESSNG